MTPTELHAAIIAHLDSEHEALLYPYRGSHVIQALRQQVQEHYDQWIGWSEMEYEDPADNPAEYHAAQLRKIADTLGLDKEQK